MKTKNELFRADFDDWENNACLNVLPGGDHVGHSEGYRLGARILVEQVISTGRDQDRLVYPIVYLYRHHVELVLKNITRRIPVLLDRDLTDDEKRILSKCHLLVTLWSSVKPLVESAHAMTSTVPLDREFLEQIETRIKQLSEVDENSTPFRYPLTTKGDPSLPTLSSFNLRHFSETMESLADDLNGIDLQTDRLEDSKLEMLYAMQQEAPDFPDCPEPFPADAP